MNLNNPMRHFNYSNEALNETLNMLKEWIISDKNLLLIFGHNREQNEIIGNRDLIEILDKLTEYQCDYKKKYIN